MRGVFLFTDGVGVGRRDPDINPLARGDFLLSRFEDQPARERIDGGVAIHIDCTFGVPGRPQSASSQTAILTGLPAPQMVGAHVLGFPTAALRAILAEHSIVKQLVTRGRSCAFANCYPGGYLDALGLPHEGSVKPEVVIPEAAKRRIKPSASTLAFAAGPVALRTLDSARAGRGLSHDIIGTRARKRGFDVPERTHAEAADILWSMDADFTMFEHYLADEAGHAQNFELATEAIASFDAFARAVIARRPADAVVIICSDHGNVEDLSVRTHTLNPVAALVYGADDLQLSTVADIGRTFAGM